MIKGVEFVCVKGTYETGVVVYTSNPSTRNSEAGGSLVYSVRLCLKKKEGKGINNKETSDCFSSLLKCLMFDGVILNPVSQM
jgi:hypothetical protein